MGWPEDGRVVLKSLSTVYRARFRGRSGRIELLGSSGLVTLRRHGHGLAVKPPMQRPNDIAYALKISPGEPGVGGALALKNLIVRSTS